MRIIAGPCQHESLPQSLEIARECKRVCDKHGIEYIFKASYDKANRSSMQGKRGMGMEATLIDFLALKVELGVKTLTDVHDYVQVARIEREFKDAVDVYQIPAFLCRQTDLIKAACATDKIVNIKKGQFLAPWDMKHVVDKAKATGNDKIMVCERGASFGYNNLVSDMRALPVLAATGCPVVFDATHSVQLPGGQGATSGGQREMVPVLARAATAVGVQGLFMETHPDPEKALSDGPNAWPLDRMQPLLETLCELDRIVKSTDFEESRLGL